MFIQTYIAKLPNVFLYSSWVNAKKVVKHDDIISFYMYMQLYMTTEGNETSMMGSDTPIFSS